MLLLLIVLPSLLVSVTEYRSNGKNLQTMAAEDPDARTEYSLDSASVISTAHLRMPLCL